VAAIVQITDDNDHVHATLKWHDATLQELTVFAKPDVWIVVEPKIVNRPLLGASHNIRTSSGQQTYMSSVAWHLPTEIPAIFSPGLLPPQTGTMLLNVIATLAANAQQSSLYYRGPYPTAALYDSATQCFAASAPQQQFVDDTWLKPEDSPSARDYGEPAYSKIRFAPDPFVRTRISERVVTQRRREIERVTIDGLAFIAGSSGFRRLQKDGDSISAQIWVGDQFWATTGIIDIGRSPNGEMFGDVVPPPMLADSIRAQLLGKSLPPQLLEALAELVAEDLPEVFQPAMRALTRQAVIEWAATGLAMSRTRGDVIEINAVIWQLLAPTGLANVVGVLVEVLSPVLKMRLQAELQACYETQ
jgi:hypothetical protein